MVASTDLTFENRPISRRLGAELSCILSHSLTCVTAPTGYRKSGLVRDYLAEIRMEVLWLNLYWDQDEEACFWGELLAAAKRRFPSAQWLDSPNVPKTDAEAARITDLLDSLYPDGSIAVVLDNYDRLETPRLDKLLQNMAQRVSSRFHFVILCQKLPQFFLHGYFFFEQCKLIGKEALRLDSGEVIAHARQLNCKYSDADLRWLAAYTCGWPSLTESMLSSMPNKRMNRSYIVRLCSRAYADTAKEQLSGMEKELLLILCHLGEFTAEQANEISGYEDVERINDLLDSLSYETIFLRKDGENYIVDGAARDYLTEESVRVDTPLVRLGSQNLIRWYLISDRMGDALRLLNSRGDLEGILRTLEENTIEKISDQDSELLVRAFHGMSFALLSAYPLAAIQIAFLLMKTELHSETGKKLLVQLQEHISKNGHPLYDQEQLIGQIDLALSTSSDRRRRASSLIQIAHLSGGGEGSSPATWIIPSFLFGIHNLPGSLRSEVENFQLLCGEEQTPALSAPIKCASVIQAEYYLEIGDLRKATYYALEGLPEEGSSSYFSMATLCAYFALAKASLFSGEQEKARALLDRLSWTLRASKDRRLNSLTDICTGYLYACMGEWDRVPNWICNEEKDSHQICEYSSYAYIIRAKRFITEKELLSFELMSKKWLFSLRSNENVLPKIHYQIQKAIAAKGLFGMPAAILELKEAFSLALPDDILIPFVENGEQLLPILLYAQRNQSLKLPDSYFSKLNQLLSGYLRRTVDISGSGDRLTARERQILQLLNEGLNYKEMASCLVISEFTVRKHIQNIYAKLNVSDRVNALLRAKELFGGLE